MADKSPRQQYCPAAYPNRIAAVTELIRWGPSTVSHAEFLVLLYYAERTLTYGKRADASSLSQIVHGIFSRKQSEWIRGPAGLSGTAVKNANTALLNRGFIAKRLAVPGETRYRPDRGNEATEYEINWTALSAEFDRRKKTPLGHQVTKPLSRVVSKPLRHVVPNNRGNSSSEGKKDRGTSKKRADAEGPASFSESPLPDKADDEKHKQPEPTATSNREPAATPEEEFRLRLDERHGTRSQQIDRNAWVADVVHDLDNGGLTLEEFLALDQRKTTNPAVIENPAGYYRSLVKELLLEKKAVILESQIAVERILTASPKEPSRCLRCQCGRLSFEEEDDLESYCPDCQTGRELRQNQQRKIAKRDASAASGVTPSGEEGSGTSG